MCSGAPSRPPTEPGSQHRRSAAWFVVRHTKQRRVTVAVCRAADAHRRRAGGRVSGHEVMPWQRPRERAAEVGGGGVVADWAQRRGVLRPPLSMSQQWSPIGLI